MVLEKRRASVVFLHKTSTSTVLIKHIVCLSKDYASSFYFFLVERKRI